MNKKWLTIGAIVILALALKSVNISYAQTTTTVKTGLDAVNELVKETKGGKKKFPGENMYLQIYQSTNQKPADNAAKIVAKKLGYTESDVLKIVKYGDLSGLIKKYKDLTLDVIQIMYKIIVDEYNNALNTENLKTELLANITPSEIFSDGDTSNSDFDLLYDLNLIEAILFDETTPSQYGGTYNGPTVEEVDKESADALKEFMQDPMGTAQKEEQAAGGEETEGVGAEQTGETAAQGTNPLDCLTEDSSLSDALKEYDDNQAATDGQGQGAEGGQGNGEGGQAEAQVPDLLTEENMPQAEPDDWPSKFLCPNEEKFCITIEFIMKDAEVKNYPKTANCIACHIQKINETLDKVNKKPLSPNKLTGNLFEMPKCKSTFTNIGANINIITMALPAPLQAQKDVFFQAKIEDEWKKFNETYRPAWYQKPKTTANKTETQTPSTTSDTAVKKAIMDAAPDATISEIQKRTSDIITKISDTAQEEVTRKVKENTREDQNRMYQLILGEVNTMNNYFKTIKETFEKLKTTCEELTSKKTCS